MAVVVAAAAVVVVVVVAVVVAVAVVFLVLVALVVVLLVLLQLRCFFMHFSIASSVHVQHNALHTGNGRARTTNAEALAAKRKAGLPGRCMVLHRTSSHGLTHDCV